MKQYIVKTLLAAASVLALAACDDNSWNDDYLDGFKEPDINSEDVQSLDYTLTDADYAAIAANKTNQTLAGEELADELANVGKLHRFTDKITAEEYLPAFLGSTSFPYFAVSNGSAVKVTYNAAEALPEELEKMNQAGEFTFTTDDYKLVYGSDVDYAEALSPSNAPSKAIPQVLADNYPDAEQGEYMVVNYNYSTTDPVFAPIGGDTPQPADWQPTSALGDLAVGDEVTVEGWITAACNRGLIFTDASGSVFGYNGSGITIADYEIGSAYKVTAKVADYNKGFQLDLPNATITKVTDESAPAYTYPAPKVLTGAEMDQMITRTDDALAEYVQMTGTVAVNGTNINIVVDGAETAKGSAYFVPDEFKALLEDGKTVTVTGYFIAIAGSRYMNMVITDVVVEGAAASAPRRVATVASTKQAELYYYNGSRWSKPNNAVALSADQCNAMTGKTYGNLTTAQADFALPIFLKQTYPYAQADDQQYVVFFNYEANAYVARQYIFDGAEWAENDGIEQTTMQFVKQSTWKADPSVVITLPAGRNIEISTKYFQACTDWVYEHIDVPLGSTSITSGFGYVTSYGNNEYYSGTSAYQGNVDLRPDKAVAQYPAGFEGMSDAEIVALLKKRFEEEVMPGALAMLHPEAAPMEGVQVTYTINFAYYDGGTHNETIVFEVTGPAEFTFVSCTWNAAE